MPGGGLGIDGLGLFGLGGSNENVDISLDALVMVGSALSPDASAVGDTGFLAVVMTGSALSPDAAVAEDADLAIPVMEGSALSPDGNLTGSYLPTVVMAGSGDMPSASIHSDQEIDATVMAGSALSPDAGIRSDQAMDAVPLTGSALSPAASVEGDGHIIAPPMTASGVAPSALEEGTATMTVPLMTGSALEVPGVFKGDGAIYAMPMTGFVDTRAGIFYAIDATVDPLTQLQVIATLGSYTWDLTDRLFNCQITTTSPGGDNDCNFQFEDTAPALILPPPAKVAFYDNGLEFWLGRVDEPKIRLRPANPLAPDGNVGGSVNLVLRGYGVSANDQKEVFGWYETTADQLAGKKTMVLKQFTPLEQAFVLVRDTICPDIAHDNSLISPLGRYLREDTSSILDNTAQQVWNALAPLGSSTLAPVLWEVAGFGSDIPKLKVWPRPTALDDPDYVIDLTECEEVALSWPLKWVYNRVTVRYAGGNVTVDDTTSQADYPVGVGVTRDYVVNAVSKLGSEGEARGVADAILAEFSKLRAIGETIRIGYPARIRDYRTGAVVRPWFVKAGRVIQVTGITMPGAPTFADNFLKVQPFFIKETSWGFNTRKLDLHTEQRETLAQAVGRVLLDAPGTVTVSTPGKPLPGVNPIAFIIPPVGGGGPIGVGFTGPKDQGPTAPDPDLKKGDFPTSDDWEMINIILKGQDGILIGDQAWTTINFSGRIEAIYMNAMKTVTDPQDTPATSDVKVWDSPNSGPGSENILALVGEITSDGSGFFANQLVSPSFQTYNNHSLGIEFVSGDADTITLSLLIRRAGKTQQNPQIITISPTPMISGVEVVLGSAGAVVVWETDQWTWGQVSYIRNDPDDINPFVHSTQWETTMAVGHAILIDGLDPETEYTFTISAGNANGKVGQFTETFTTEADITEIDLRILNPVGVPTTSTTAEISWETDIPAQTELTIPEAGLDFVDDNLDTYHNVSPNSLTPGTTYTFTITATDANGNTAVHEGTFDTPEDS